MYSVLLADASVFLNILSRVAAAPRWPWRAQPIRGWAADQVFLRLMDSPCLGGMASLLAPQSFSGFMHDRSQTTAFLCFQLAVALQTRGSRRDYNEVQSPHQLMETIIATYE